MFSIRSAVVVSRSHAKPNERPWRCHKELGSMVETRSVRHRALEILDHWLHGCETGGYVRCEVWIIPRSFVCAAKSLLLLF